jgi:hypothetical protein
MARLLYSGATVAVFGAGRELIISGGSKGVP